MKKGVILSVNKFSITLLTPDGEFEKSRRLKRNYEIGEEIIYQPTENPLKSLLYFPVNKTAVISAVVTCIMLFSIVIPRFSTHVYAYMTIDVNPSIELGLDDNLQVVEMSGINADGQHVKSQIHKWKNKDVSDVAEKIVLKTKELGYINDTTRKIIVSETVIKDDKKLDKQLNQEIKDFINEMPIPNTEVILIHATESDRNKAKQQGISTGKFIKQRLDEEKRKNEKSDLEKKNNNQNKKENINTSNSCKEDKISNKTYKKKNYDYKNTKYLDQSVMASADAIKKNNAVLTNKSKKNKNQSVTASYYTNAKVIKKNQKEKNAVLTNKSSQMKNQNVMVKHNVSAEAIKKNQKEKNAVLTNKSNQIKEQNVMVRHSVSAEVTKKNQEEQNAVLTNKSNHLDDKGQIERKENSNIKNNNLKNKKKSKIKSNVGNKGNSKIKSKPGNKKKSKIKSNVGNKGNLKIKSNSENKKKSKIKSNPNTKGNSWNKRNKGKSRNKGNKGHSWNQSA